LAIVLSVAAGVAQAQSAHVNGTAGYLSEWEFNGDLVPTGASGKAFTGAVTWKHVGLCSVHGLEQKSGAMIVQISDTGPASEVHATLQLDGAQCNYSGPLSESSTGRMDCSDAKGIPLTLWITSKRAEN
jgi:hypothetical protein